jgi:hypothetical protein
MTGILNITNGECAAQLMRQADIAGTILTWDDVLHEGPVPPDLPLEALSDVRARFVAAQGWGDPGSVRQRFARRDRTLASCASFEKIVLWFEHDLYDQLQLLQLLDWFERHRPPRSALSMICVDQYLGTLTPVRMRELLRYERPVSAAQLALARSAWAAFRADSPRPWFALLETDTSALPFLAAAIVRLLEEYPACHNGLSRTARTALEIIARGERQPGRIFGRYQLSEQRRFLGDTSFWKILAEFMNSSPPLLESVPPGQIDLPGDADSELVITPAGEAVREGRANWLELAAPERWIGGVHLSADAAWCWDVDARSIAQRC